MESDSGKVKKTVVILHGWPQGMTQDHLLYRYFEKKGWKVVAPWLFGGQGKFGFREVDKLVKIKPDVIVGISLGGLLVPHLAVEYPEAKLVFVATSMGIKSASQRMRNIIKLGRLVGPWLYKIPQNYLVGLYRKINSFKGVESQREDYEKDLRENLKCAFGISLEKHIEIVDFVESINNIDLLKELKNQSLVIAGKGDVIMPLSAGEELSKLLINSRFLVAEGSHFNVLTECEIAEIERFLD